jgi:hypothetical protein
VAEQSLEILNVHHAVAGDIAALQSVTLQRVRLVDVTEQSLEVLDIYNAIAGDITLRDNLKIGNLTVCNDNLTAIGRMVILADGHSVDTGSNILDDILSGIPLHSHSMYRCAATLEEHLNGHIVGTVDKACHNAAECDTAFTAICAIAAVAFAGIDHGEALQTFGAMLTGIRGAFIAHLT